MNYDLVIIGGGPAGTAAAVYAARKQLTTLLITAEFGGQSVVSTDIQNWIGTPHISGAELAHSLEAHVNEYKGEVLTVKKGILIDKITKEADNAFTLHSAKESFTTKTVLITTGSNRRRLAVPGADAFEHKGLTYCASCDGPVFSGQNVAVLGGGNAAFESAAQLLAYCPHVYLIHRGDSFRADEITVAALKKNPNLTIITEAQVTAVTGDTFVSGLTYTDKGGEHTLDVAGIFVEIGQLPNTDFVADILERDEYNKITIDPWTGKTSTPGIWAAGDCTNIRYHQNNIAAGEAVKALEDIYVTLKTS